MTGTVYTCLHKNQSQSYLNHLVHSKKTCAPSWLYLQYYTFCSCVFYSSPSLPSVFFLFSCDCCMYNYHICVENILSVADFFGMLTVKIQRSSSTVMSQFSLFGCVCAYSWTAPVNFIMSVCIHGPDQVTLNRFLWNLILGTFMKICEENPHLVKTEQKYWTLYVNTYILCCQWKSHHKHCWQWCIKQQYKRNTDKHFLAKYWSHFS